MASLQSPSHGDDYVGMDRHILRTPIWILGLRVAQVVLSVLVLALAGTTMREASLDELGLAVATSVITWIVVTYAVLTERVPSCRPAYHIVAVLSLEVFLVILWLATFASVAAQRGQFVNANSCSGPGCHQKRLTLSKRASDAMSAAAGIGALVWLMFIATFVWTLLQFISGRKQGRFPINTAGKSDVMPENQTALKEVRGQYPQGSASKSLGPYAPHQPSAHSPPSSSQDQNQI